MEVLPISKIAYSPSERHQDVWAYEAYPFIDETELSRSVDELTARLVDELRNARRDHFASGEVLLPFGLLQRISRDILAQAEEEPCGIRGCTLYLQFKGEDVAGDKGIALGCVQFDPSTASTFEITLLLKQSSTGWNSFLPQFLKKITRGGTVMIDSDYKLEKNKLYRSYLE